MKRLTLKTAPLLALLLMLLTPAALADDGEGCVTVTVDGAALFTLAGEVSEGDEYISADNTLYRIESVSGGAATAVRIGQEDMPDVSWLDAGDAQAVFAASVPAASSGTDSASGGGQKLIAMYVTHSDESYIPSDGTQSIEGQGGIYDVARQVRDALQAQGIDVILDESTHLPHDSGAYRRSRQTAERLLENRPDAIIDIHRDGIPDQSEYTLTVNGENVSRVRLLVGRSNQNSAVNREFAKQLKAVADKKYPGLVKDIFIGKGNYNQDLSPNAILLEFGTHTISKERVLESTGLMANVVSTALYGEQTGSAQSRESAAKAEKAKNKSASGSVVWMIVIVIVAVLIFAFVQTGGGKGMKTKLGRGVSEITGGLMGKKPEEGER